MTTSDLIAEALIRFRKEIMTEVHAEIRKAIRPAHFITKPKTEVYRHADGSVSLRTYNSDGKLVSSKPIGKIEIKCAPDCVACARNREIMQDKFPRHTLD